MLYDWGTGAKRHFSPRFTELVRDQFLAKPQTERLRESGFEAVVRTRKLQYSCQMGLLRNWHWAWSYSIAASHMRFY